MRSVKRKYKNFKEANKMKTFKGKFGWWVETAHIRIDRMYKTEYSAESFTVEIKAFGYRVRWTPTYNFFCASKI